MILGSSAERRFHMEAYPQGRQQSQKCSSPSTRRAKIMFSINKNQAGIISIIAPSLRFARYVSDPAYKKSNILFLWKKKSD